MYRNGRQQQTRDQASARRRLHRGAHGLVLIAQGDRPVREVSAKASKLTRLWEDLRRGRVSIYGALLRFIDISIALGVPKSVLKTIPEMIDWYIEDQYGPTDTAEIRLVA